MGLPFAFKAIAAVILEHDLDIAYLSQKSNPAQSAEDVALGLEEPFMNHVIR